MTHNTTTHDATATGVITEKTAPRFDMSVYDLAPIRTGQSGSFPMWADEFDTLDDDATGESF
jgi:hypothetical protein